MDPLVRTAARAQQWASRYSGYAFSAGFGVMLVVWARLGGAPWWAMVALGGLVVSFGLRLARRLSRLSPRLLTQLDIELFTHAVVLAYAGILLAPEQLSGPAYPVIYAVVMLAAAFTGPVPALATVGFAVAVEAALHFVAFEHQSLAGLWPHALLLGVFAFLNMVVFRAEIARVRRLSKRRIAGEIERMKEAARSYRLLGSPSSALAPSSVGSEDLERLLQSGVDEIHQSLNFALGLLRESLELRTAVLLWLDAKGAELTIREIATSDDSILPGPFSARDGVIAAALMGGHPVSLTGKQAQQSAPHYSIVPEVGAICAVPVVESSQARGVLLVDRPKTEAFDEGQQELLTLAARFMLRSIENERVFVQLDRAKSEQGKLYRAVNALAAATTEASVVEACVSSAREVASFDFAAVTLLDKHRSEHEICAVSGEQGLELVGKRFRHNTGLVSMVVANRHPLPYRGDYDEKRQVVFTRRLKPPNMPALFVLPLSVHESVLGSLVLGSHRAGAFGDGIRRTLEVLASHVAVSLSNARMVKRLEELATTDGLTGLLNKRALIEAADQKLRSSYRFKKSLSVLVCDIDHFKKVNDTYGHDVGDVVIQGLGEALRRRKRDTDVVGRFGGEEFVIVCEETDSEGAALLAERIRSELEATQFFTEKGTLKVTCSIGVATYPHAGHDWETLFKATDEALYASKRGGRNRVTVWTPGIAGSGCAA